MDPTQMNFETVQIRVPVFFYDFSSYLADKYFDVVPTAEVWIGCIFFMVSHYILN